MKIYYRISDNNRKGKAPDYFTNENCLNNFIKNFRVNQSELVIIADNISDKTMQWLQNYEAEIIRTSLGNCGSFDFAYNKAIAENEDEDIIYFVENDYLHREGARNALMEAFNYCKADYVNLYDSPERYKKHFNVNYNKELDILLENFKSYKSEVIYGINDYWRTVNTATMTFASKVKILKSDQYVFKSALLTLTEKEHPYRKIPGDYELFCTLVDVKSRLMITPIPGYATHGDLLSPKINWKDYL
jgi:glycosyltransferase involved in cell wall biosynthesis